MVFIEFVESFATLKSGKETKREHIGVDLLKVLFTGWFIQKIFTKLSNFVVQKNRYFLLSVSTSPKQFFKERILFPFLDLFLTSLIRFHCFLVLLADSINGV